MLLYGSCVSRDMFEFLPEQFTLVEYVARQSMISTISPPVPLPREPALKSDFQRRMVRGDFASALGSSLHDRATEIDILVLDLIDERLGVIPVSGCRYLTRSQELLDSGLLDE